MDNHEEIEIKTAVWSAKFCMFIVWALIVTLAIKGYTEGALILSGLFFLALMLSVQLGNDLYLTRKTISRELGEIYKKI